MTAEVRKGTRVLSGLHKSQKDCPSETSGVREGNHKGLNPCTTIIAFSEILCRYNSNFQSIHIQWVPPIVIFSRWITTLIYQPLSTVSPMELPGCCHKLSSLYAITHSETTLANLLSASSFLLLIASKDRQGRRNE